MVFVDELLFFVEEFFVDDIGVFCGWVSILKRRRLVFFGEGELKRLAVDILVGGDISIFVIIMFISYFYFIGRFFLFFKRR